MISWELVFAIVQECDSERVSPDFDSAAKESVSGWKQGDWLSGESKIREHSLGCNARLPADAPNVEPTCGPTSANWFSPHTLLSHASKELAWGAAQARDDLVARGGDKCYTASWVKEEKEKSKTPAFRFREAWGTCRETAERFFAPLRMTAFSKAECRTAVRRRGEETKRGRFGPNRPRGNSSGVSDYLRK